MNTHHPASLYEEFEPAEARRIAERLEVHYTPKSLATRLDRVAGSWMDMAEIEIGALARQCLNRCISDQSTLRREVGAWQQQRNRDAIRVDWRFTTSDARIKLKPLYPSAFNLRRNCSDLRGSEQLPAASSRWYKPRVRQVPKTEASVILVSVPWFERVPPLIFRLTTTGRRLRSAMLLSEDTSGCATKTKSSPYPVRGRLLMWRSMRRHSLPLA